MKKALSVLLALSLCFVGVFMFASCGRSISGGGSAQIPQELAEIPSDYYSEADEQGTLVELDYDTCESFSYEEETQPLRKRAIVYLPYGYSEEESYNIVYMMHGGWSNETTTLGTPSAPSSFKNVIDNAVQNGAFAPLIIVCQTYNNTNENGQDSDNYSLALQLTRNYHNELINDLLGGKSISTRKQKCERAQGCNPCALSLLYRCRFAGSLSAVGAAAAVGIIRGGIRAGACIGNFLSARTRTSGVPPFEDRAPEQDDVQHYKRRARNDAGDERGHIARRRIRRQKHQREAEYDRGQALIYQVFARGGAVAAVDLAQQDHARARRAREHSEKGEELFVPIGGEQLFADEVDICKGEHRAEHREDEQNAPIGGQKG